MIEDGLFERFPAEQVFALHNWPGLPPGRIGITPGPAMAAADRIEITIDGRGGHGAHPHAAIDPVLVAGHIITAAQSIVTRNVSPIDTAVVSLCAMHAGNPGAMSVIPSHATLVGTVRTFRPATQDMIERRLARARAVDRRGVRRDAPRSRTSASTRRPSTTTARPSSPRTVAEALVGRDNVVRNLDPSMGSEDFSFMLQAKPGAFARLGQGGAEGGCFLHNSTYDFNDAVIPLGAGYLAALAETRDAAREVSGRRADPRETDGSRSAVFAELRRGARQVRRGRAGAAPGGRDARAAGPPAASTARRWRWTSRSLGPPRGGRPAGADLGDARHRGLLRLGLRRSACCATTDSSGRWRTARIAVLLVHAVNPHGFSHGRRVNEDNVDLNRNFRDFTAPAPVNAAYADVHPLLLPATWPPPPENEAAIGAYIAAHGERAFQAAVTGGQYAFPDGLFFGGTHADLEQSDACARVLRRSRVEPPARRLDRFPHRRSGRAATGRRSTPVATRPPIWRAPARWWGAEVTSFYDGSSTSAPHRRLRHRRRLRRMPRRRIHRDRARVRDAAAAAGAAGAARRPLAAQPSRGARRAARGDPAADARRVLRRRRRLEGAGVRAGARAALTASRGLPETHRERSGAARAAWTATSAAASATRRWRSSRPSCSRLPVAALFAPWVAPHNPFDLRTLNLLDALAPPAWLAGAQAGLPARHRRPGPRRAVGDHVRRAHLAARRPRVGRARDRARRLARARRRLRRAASSTRSSCASPTSSSRFRRS